MKATANALLLARVSGHRLYGVGVLLTLVLTMLYASVAWADTFTVTNLNDTGAGSLREAIQRANARAGADQIVFADGLSGTITLRSQLPEVVDPAGLSIDGGEDATVSGNDRVRVLWVGEGASLSLKGLTISHGRAPIDSDGLSFGGGILNHGSLTVNGSTISDNTALIGGGISNGGNPDLRGTAELINATISDNTAVVAPSGGGGGGGGVYNSGTLMVTDSTLSTNIAEAGGTIYSESGTLEVVDSTVSGNDADRWGGGMFILDASAAKIVRTTLSSNYAGFDGGGVYHSAFTLLEIVNSHIANNSVDGGSGGGIYASGVAVVNSTVSGNRAPGRFGGGISGNSMSLRATMLANNPQGGNCGRGSSVFDGGYNVEDDDTCGFTRATGSLPNTNPLLDPAGLSDNGGPTPTIALLPNSPAVDLVAKGVCPPPQTDQRGVERPQGDSCDAGAFELVQGPQQPQTKADCKQGGYKRFGFKNQGQCVAFVNRAAHDR